MYKSCPHFIHYIKWLENWLKRFIIWIIIQLIYYLDGFLRESRDQIFRINLMNTEAWLIDRCLTSNFFPSIVAVNLANELRHIFQYETVHYEDFLSIGATILDILAKGSNTSGEREITGLWKWKKMTYYTIILHGLCKFQIIFSSKYFHGQRSYQCLIFW